MILKINGNTYDGINWSINNNEGTITFPVNNNSFNNIVSEFINSPEIEIYDNNMQLISKWFTREIIGINRINTDYVIIISGNNIPQDMNENLQERLTDTENALVELAGMLSQVELVNQSQISFVQQYREQTQASMNQSSEQMATVNTRFNETLSLIQNVEHMIEPIQAKQTQLENSINSMPQNVNARLTKLENDYNTMADRIATIGNHYDAILEAISALEEITQAINALEYHYNSLNNRIAQLENN